MGVAMKAQFLPAFAAALAGGAIGTLVTLSMTRPETSLAADPEAAIHARIVDSAGPAVDERFRELEARLTRLSMVKPNDSPRMQARQPGEKESDSTAVDARLAALEEDLKARQAEARQRLTIADQNAALLGNIVVRRTRMSEEDAQSNILDASKSDSEKVAAWAVLRSAETWDDSVVSEMIAIGENSTDPEIREDVWRQADARASSPLLVAPLLRALQSDPNAGVRSEAAETLENYLGEPGVRNALIYAAENDSSEDVRKEARGALN